MPNFKSGKTNSPEDTSSEDAIPPGRWYEQLILRAAQLPWWAIILAVVAVSVLYSMLTSSIYRNTIRSLIDNPQVSTDNLYQVVQIVGEPEMIVGRYVGETQDSVQTVIRQLLTNVLDSEQVTRSGFIAAEDPSTISIQTDGGLVTIARDQIKTMEPSDAGLGDDVTVGYIDRITVTGTLTEQDGDTMTVRTVDEEKTTFDKSRIIEQETTTIACDKAADPNCQDREVATISRRGEQIVGTLTTLSQTGLSLQLPDGGTREFRRADMDYFYVPTLTIAVNQDVAETPVAPGSEVRIGFVEGSDITAALEQLESLDNVPVPLRYGDGDARAILVPYDNLDSLLKATGEGEVDGLVYLESGQARMAVAEWVEQNPDAGVVLPAPPGECSRNCEVTVKLLDDEISGTVLNDTGDTITVRTVEPEYVVIDKDKIVDNRRKVPGECALNNLRGCNEGIFLTLRVTFSAYLMALVIGLFVGLMRVQRNPVIYALSTLYVEVIRGIPLLVILLYAGFVVSPWLRDHTPLKMGDQSEAIIGLAFGYGAFVAEIFRAGIQSINRGQMEAARSLGMSYPQSMRYVILPQAVRVVLPPLGNDFISMLKDSALISVLALPDLLQLGRLHISRTFRAFEGYNTVAMLYLLMTLFLSFIVRTIERRSRLPQ